VISQNVWGAANAIRFAGMPEDLLICSFVCPVSDIISFTEMPAQWKRQDAEVMDKSLETQIKYKPFISTM